ncbi:MAG TPA: lytic transglycosylase domain-containing protein [Bacillota bacterium]|jgi:soluble lytic murein transglycosylase|nr:lytic transglycosylase domain-containing protein [Bacillota bacterium]
MSRKPKRSAPKRRKPTTQKKSSMGLGLRIVTGILGVIISPVVFAVSIFRPSMKMPKRWPISLTVLIIILAVYSWAGVKYVDQLSVAALDILGDYSSARLEVRDMPFAETINFEGLRNGIDPCLVAAVISQESGFQTDAVSWRGARGLMQLMPDTWQEFMPSAQCSGDHAPPACGNMCIYNPDANIHVGTAYLRYLIDRYDGDIIAALASYNAGMSAVDDAQADLDSIQNDIPPYPETQGHVGNVVQAWTSFRSGLAEWRVRAVERAARARNVTSWIAVGLLFLFMIWAAVRYPE